MRSVDPFGLTNPLDLLPPEVLPGITFTGTQAPALTEETNTNLLPTVSGHVFGVVEEEQLNANQPQADSGQGNEDTNDELDNDHDTSNSGPGSQITTQIFSGTLAGLVSGGNLPITFLTNVGANGTTSTTAMAMSSPQSVWRFTTIVSAIQRSTARASDGRLIFTLTMDAERCVHVHAERSDRSSDPQP